MTEKAPSYADLLVEIQPRPIGSKAALEKSYKLIDKLMSKPALSRAESEMLELLSMLVEQYESRHHPTPQPLLRPPSERAPSHCPTHRGRTLQPSCLQMW